MDQKSILEAIECHIIFGEFKEAEKLKKTYFKKLSILEPFMSITKNQTFLGILTAIGWDRFDHVNRLSLYTSEDEDIILDHKSKIKRFIPYLNKNVRIFGDVTSSIEDGRRIAIKRISNLRDGFNMLASPYRDEFGDLLP